MRKRRAITTRVVLTFNSGKTLIYYKQIAVQNAASFYLQWQADLLTGLTISEDTSVVTLEGVVEDVASQAVEHDFLAREVLERRVQGTEAVVESEAFWLLPAIHRKNMGTQYETS